MRTLIVYESMYGNTHVVADHIAVGLRSSGEVDVVPVAEASAERVRWADLLVVGGPTHMHGMTSGTSRKAALDPKALAKSEESGHHLEVDPDAEGPGLRSWLDGVADGRPLVAAAFDTRLDAPPLLVGRASKGIARRLEHEGVELVAPPESFLVDKHSALLPGEDHRATGWGHTLLEQVAARAARASDPS